VRIKFYDENGVIITTVETEAQDHWDACSVGHRYLNEGTIRGAEDFDVIDPGDFD
jgi:hypothetical protein